MQNKNRLQFSVYFSTCNTKDFLKYRGVFFVLFSVVTDKYSRYTLEFIKTLIRVVFWNCLRIGVDTNNIKLVVWLWLDNKTFQSNHITVIQVRMTGRRVINSFKQGDSGLESVLVFSLHVKERNESCVPISVYLS